MFTLVNIQTLNYIQNFHAKQPYVGNDNWNFSSWLLLHSCIQGVTTNVQIAKLTCVLKPCKIQHAFWWWIGWLIIGVVNIIFSPTKYFHPPKEDQLHSMNSLVQTWMFHQHKMGNIIFLQPQGRITYCMTSTLCLGHFIIKFLFAAEYLWFFYLACYLLSWTTIVGSSYSKVIQVWTFLAKNITQQHLNGTLADDPTQT